MDDIEKRIDTLERKLDAILQSVERTRRYFMMFLVASLLMVVLPLLGLAIVIPKVLRLYTSVL